MCDRSFKDLGICRSNEISVTPTEISADWLPGNGMAEGGLCLLTDQIAVTDSDLQTTGAQSRVSLRVELDDAADRHGIGKMAPDHTMLRLLTVKRPDCGRKDHDREKRSLCMNAAWPRRVLAAYFRLALALFGHQRLDLRPALREEVLALE